MISNSAGYIGNLIGSALYWNPTNKLYNTNGTYNVVSNTFINPVQLANAYTDYATTCSSIISISIC